jgi:DNA-binding transcriptional LysR family regulator
MNIASVRLFLEVAEAGSLSKVAARRQTVQSHISRQISEFEAGFGAALFRRTGRGVALTDVGRRAMPKLARWLQDTERLEHELQSDAGTLGGVVRLGIIPSAAHPLMTRLFTRLQAEHPGIRLSIAEAQGIELDSMLDTGSVDLGVLFRFNPPRGGDEKQLGVAHSYLVSAPGDALTAQPTVDFSRLDGLSLVLPRRPSQWRTALDEAARGLGFRLEPVAEADSLAVQKELTACTPGLYTVMGPFAISPDLKRGRLKASRLTNPDLVRHVALASPKQGTLSPACKRVAQIIEETTRSWGDQLDEP